MKVEIEIKDLETFSKALNNAMIVYWDMIASINLGLHPQINGSRFKPLESLPEEELLNRRNALLDVYNQIERIEQNR